MLKKILFLLLICSLVFAQIEVERVIENNQVEPGGTVEIEIVIDLNNVEPSSIIVTEAIPEGWEVTDSNPSADDFDGKIKWLIFGDSLQDGMTLEYTLKAPEDFTETAELNGQWDLVGPEGGPVFGDYVLISYVPEEPEPGDEEITEDYTLYYVIGALIVVIVALILMKKKK